MEDYFMAAFEQLLEERIEQYIAQGMDEGDAETRAEQELDAWRPGFVADDVEPFDRELNCPYLLTNNAYILYKSMGYGFRYNTLKLPCCNPLYTTPHWLVL